MRRSCFVFQFHCGCLLLSTTALAQADDEAAHAALRALVAEYEQAIENGAPTVLKPYLADDFTGVMVTGEAVDGFEDLQTYWDKIQGLLGEGGKYKVKVEVPEPATIVGDLAFAHGTTSDRTVTSDGTRYDFQGFWTAICRRDGEGWKIVRVHGSMDAITNTFVTAAIKQATLAAGLLGGFIGLLLGAALVWLLKRGTPPAAAA